MKENRREFWQFEEGRDAFQELKVLVVHASALYHKPRFNLRQGATHRKALKMKPSVDAPLPQRCYLLATLIGLVALLLSCDKPQDRPRRSSSQTLGGFREMIAARPAPDLGRLAERSAPNYTGGDTIESFYDVLKLRDVGEPDAVPVLEKILSDHAGSTRIHGFAAAQALFCIDTPEAHKILAKYLLTSRYNTLLAINYTSHWEMREPERSRFIKRYHLKNLSKDLTLELSAKTQWDNNGRRIDCTVLLRNISGTPFRIRDRQVYLAKMLHFQSEGGTFARSRETVVYKPPMLTWLELAPGASREYNIPVRIKEVHQLKRRYRWLSEDANLVADTFDVMFDIKKTGRFKVYAMFEDQPLTEAQRGRLDFDKPWSGRAVSEPVTVEILEKRSQHFPEPQVYRLATVMGPLAASIRSSPAESFSRDHREYGQVLHMSSGSCAELETHTEMAGKLNHSADNRGKLLPEKLDHLCRMISNLLEKLWQSAPYAIRNTQDRGFENG